MTQVNNNTTLIGRLVRDIEGTYVKDGEMFIGTATLAVDRRGEGADYIRIKLLGNHWEKVANYMNKGTQVGTFKQDNMKTLTVTATLRLMLLSIIYNY